MRDEKTDLNSWKYRNDERIQSRREQGCFPRHLSVETNRVAKPHRSTPPFPPESMLHEFTAETTRSRNTALQPIFVELPRFVNDKGSKDIFRHAANRSTDCRGPENDSYRVPHFRFHARKWNKRELDIYILFNLDGRYRVRWGYNVYFRGRQTL